MSLGYPYNDREASYPTVSPLDDDSSSPTSFTPGQRDAFDQPLLSPHVITSPISSTLGISANPVGKENRAYNRLVQENNQLRNELAREREQHNELKWVSSSLSIIIQDHLM